MQTYLFLICYLPCGCFLLNTNSLPQLNNNYSPLDPVNQSQLFSRLTTAYDLLYSQKDDYTKINQVTGRYVYYLRQELQSLIDMWRATKNTQYLLRAKSLVNHAISKASNNQKPLIVNGENKGLWPCFFEKSLESITGGHGQLYDFQGSAGFLLVAEALEQANMEGGDSIATFVENQIIEKWLKHKNIDQVKINGNDYDKYLLILLDSGRDKREHFTNICLSLDKLGKQKYPYKTWAFLLTDLYLKERTSISQKHPLDQRLGRLAPNDWGLLKNPDNTLTWFWMLNWKTKELSIQDSSHANRTVWLACTAYHNKLLDKNTLDSFILTFKQRIWQPDKKIFYFTNYIDGTDTPVQGLGPGRKGNVWFGWHRLAAYDKNLRDLFISMAYDLTLDCENFPYLSQNTRMENAPLCLIAWGARLLAENGGIQQFP